MLGEQAILEKCNRLLGNMNVIRVVSKKVQARMKLSGRNAANDSFHTGTATSRSLSAETHLCSPLQDWPNRAG